MKIRVLLVDDNAELLDIARILFQQTDPNLEVVVRGSVKDALETLENEEIDVVISDYLMPDATGLDFLEALRSAGDNIGFIMWTGHSREDVAIKALNLGADYYLLKGSSIKEQFNIIRDIIRKVIAAKYQSKQKAMTQGIPTVAASEFIHQLSHDITGLLHNIMGYATLLEEEYDRAYIQGIAKLVTKISDRVNESVSVIDEEKLLTR
jgi:DNA-binding NtrC family response regulator